MLRAIENLTKKKLELLWQLFWPWGLILALLKWLMLLLNSLTNNSQIYLSGECIEDALNRAQSVLVNFHHNLKLSKYWGDGTTSSSDGMRMHLGVSSLHADFNPHYGNGKGTTIYRFTSDQFSSYYTKIIHTNSRDATHVLDGLMNHETDLNIQEHYTDTAGYTDQVFGLTQILGFRFAPRIRDLAEVKLFSLNGAYSHKGLNSLLRGKINENIIRDNYDDVLRLAASIREGTVPASLILSKIGSYSRQNGLSNALREMGKN